MIKKLNIVLALAFVAMFALKGVKEIRSSKDKSAPAQVAQADAEPSIPAPNVYYSYWACYSVENPLSNRNGVILDTMRAIFPNAKFLQLRDGSEAFAKAMQDDPHAVVVGFGKHPSFSGSVTAPTPVVHAGFVLMTLRTNPWRYKGEKSLSGIRIATTEEYLDYDLIRGIRDRQGAAGVPKLYVAPGGTPQARLVEMVENGEADAFVATGITGTNGVVYGAMSAYLLQRLRMSDEIGRAASLLHVSPLDKEYAKLVVDEYERGMERITKNGERRRLFEYYGMTDEPAKPAAKP